MAQAVCSLLLLLLQTLERPPEVAQPTRQMTPPDRRLADALAAGAARAARIEHPQGLLNVSRVKLEPAALCRRREGVVRVHGCIVRGG